MKIAVKAGNDSREKLMLAAEALFLEQGMGSLSARQIAKRAGQRNVCAVQYHFGTIEELIKELTLFRMGQLEPVREEMLANAEAAGRLKDLRTLIEMICLPHLTLHDAEGRHPYAALLASYLPRYMPFAFPWVIQPMTDLPQLQKLIGLIRDRLDFMPADFVMRRLTSMIVTFLNLLLARDYGHELLVDDRYFLAAMDDTLDQLVVAMAMPPQHDQAGGEIRSFSFGEAMPSLFSSFTTG